MSEVQPSTRAGVTVTFLRMDQPPADPPRPLPEDVILVHVARPSVPFYRYLYGTVGGPHLWWLRRAVTDEALAALLADPGIAIVVLYRGGEPAGFFELDARPRPVINLAYFGLMPFAVGQGLGTPFLRAAVDTAWRWGAKAVTVNTCTADHPRALPGYMKAGFTFVRSVREIWDIPNQLGLIVPPHLRA